MIISVCITLCWILAALSVVVARKVPHQPFAFAFLIANFINSNVYYLFGETLHFFELSKDPLRYVSFSLLQSIIIPLFIAIVINLSLQVRAASTKWSFHTLAIALLACGEVLIHSTQIVSYSGYPMLLWLIGYRMLLYITTMITLRYFIRMCSRS